MENVDAIGEAIAAGICDYFGVKYVEPVKPAEPSEDDTLYRVQVGAFKVRENAERYRDKLRDMGISAFIVKV